ncbi:MAG: hypothetical protein ABI237_05810 [Ginsengibacter sp.]
MQIIFTESSIDVADSLFRTGDYNGDGIPDFRLEKYSSEGKTYYDYYIFDKEEKIFKFDAKLSESY